MKHRVPLHQSLIASSDWYSYAFPRFYPHDEVSEWLKANVRGRYKVVAARVGRWSFSKLDVRVQNFRPVVAFGRKDDAALFKLFWWRGEA